MFIFDRCCRSSAAVTPVKYECDTNNLTGTSARSKVLLTEKLTNGALVTPTPDPSTEEHAHYKTKQYLGKCQTFCSVLETLTHLPLVPYICVMESGQYWIRWWLGAYSEPCHYLNQYRVVVNWTLRKNFSEILIKIQNFSFMEMHMKISSGEWRPYCPGRDELINRQHQRHSPKTSSSHPVWIHDQTTEFRWRSHKLWVI